MLRVANSTPIVDFDSKLNSLRVKRESKLLLPTPESPISTTVKRKGNVLFIIFFLSMRNVNSINLELCNR